jgi:hypothetical protein
MIRDSTRGMFDETSVVADDATGTLAHDSARGRPRGPGAGIAGTVGWRW